MLRVKFEEWSSLPVLAWWSWLVLQQVYSRSDAGEAIRTLKQLKPSAFLKANVFRIRQPLFCCYFLFDNEGGNLSLEFFPFS